MLLNSLDSERRARAFAVSAVDAACPDCTKLNCDQILTPVCQAKCGPGLQPWIDKCQNTPLKPSTSLGTLFGPGAFTGGPSKTANVPVVQDTSVDADCNSWGVFKALCVAGKSATKGGQAAGSVVTNFFGNLGGPCIPGVGIPCWIIVVAAIGALVLFTLLRRR